MYLRFSFNSNNLNVQVNNNKLYNLKYWDYAPGLAFNDGYGVSKR